MVRVELLFWAGCPSYPVALADLRAAVAEAGLDPEGVYVGTSNGEVYASADGGEAWQRLPGTLPPVLSVTAAVF